MTESTLRPEPAIVGAERYLALAEALPAMVAVSAPDGSLTYVNRAWVEYTGLTLDELNADRPRIIHPDDLDRVLQVNAAARREGLPIEVDYRLRRHDGEYRWHYWRAVPVRDPRGAIVEWIGTTTDIHDRKQAEINLLESEARANAVLDTSIEGILTFDQAGIVESINPAAERLFGYAAGDLAGRDIATLIPALAGAWREEFSARRNGATPGGGMREVLGRRADGSTFPVHFAISEVPLAGRTIYTGIIHDLTERAAAEHVLRVRVEQQASVARLGQLALSAPLDTLFAEAARELALHLDVEFTKVLQLLPGADALRMVAGAGWQEGSVGTLIPTGTNSQGGYVLAQHTPVIVHDLRDETRFRPEPLFVEHGVVSGMSMLLRSGDRDWGVVGAHSRRRREFTSDDLQYLISVANVLSQAIQRDETEDALRESEENFRTLARTIPAHVITMDPQGAYVFGNDAYLDYVGLTLQEASNWEQHQIIHPDDYDSATALWRRALETGEPLRNEMRIRRHDGQYRWFLVNVAPLKDASGAVTRWNCVAVDIEDQKRIERALSESEAELARQRNQLQLVTDTTPALISYIDTGLRFRYANSQYEEWLGRPMSDVVDGYLPDLLGETAYATLRPHIERAFNGEHVTFEEFIVYPNGHPRWVRGNYTPDVARDGTVRGLFALITDITVRRREEITRTLLAELGEGLTATLDYDETIHKVIASTVPAFADFCVVSIRRDEGRVMRVANGYVERTSIVTDTWNVDSTTHTYTKSVLLTGEPVYLPVIDDGMLQRAARDEVELEGLRAARFTSSLIVPMKVRGEVIGAIGFCTAESMRRFTEADLATAEEVARRAALALENARLYREARQALEQAERANQNLQFLAEASAIVAESLDYEVTLRNLARLAVPFLADWCTIDLRDSDGQIMRLAIAGDDPDLLNVAEQLRERYPADPEGRHGSALVMRTGQREFIPEISEDLIESELKNDDERRDAIRRFALRSALTEPLIAHGRVLGAITLLTSGDRRLADEHVRLAAEFTRRAAIALENAQLYREARTALEQREDALFQAETANATLRFLADARSVLSESLDFNEALDRLMDALVPRLADWASIVARRPDGTFERITQGYASEEWRRYGERPLLEVDPDAKVGVPAVIASGQPQLFEQLPDALFESYGESDQGHHLRDAGARSAVIIPMRFTDGTVAALTLASGVPGRYRPDDLDLLQEFTHRAAVALDNARLFTELRQTAEDLRRANAAKDEFLGLVSHELKTPITTIMGNAEVLYRRGDTLDDESRRDALIDIRNEGERLHRIIENLLVLARLERGKEVEIEPLLLHRLAERLADEHRRRFPHREVRVIYDEDQAPAWGEPNYVELVLRNLLSNAEKYSPPHEPIEIHVADAEGGIAVEVRDRGVGIPENEVEQLFTAFYRSPNVAGNVQGIGIGLAVCRRLIEVQSGHIWAARREGGGSVFAFALPGVSDDAPVLPRK